MKHKTVFFGHFLLTGLLWGAASATALADDTDERADESSAPLIEEIVVTATRREESVRDVAASVTAISGQQLEEAGFQDIESIVDAVPGVSIVDDYQGLEPQRITIRGIAAGRAQNDTVGVFLDETPFTDVFLAYVTADANPFDMSTVEVLKGPVGTLFGGSALNGAIRYIPQKPQFGVWQTKAFSQFSTNTESEDIGHISGVAVNIPVFETLALRVVGNNRRSEGFIDSLNQTYAAKDTNAVTQQNLRGILRWQPLAPLDLSLMFLHQDTVGHDLSTTDVASGGRYERIATPRPLPTNTRYKTWQLKGLWAFDWADLVFVASDSRKHFDSVGDLSYIAEPDPQASTAGATVSSDGKPRSQELRFVSTPGGNWDWLAGVYNYAYHVNSNVNILSGEDFGNFAAVPAETDADVTEKSVFGEVSWHFADGFTVTGGLRRYEFSYLGEIFSEGQGCVVIDPTCPLTGLRGAVELDQTERGINPKLSLKWEVTDALMGYASAARGYRFGGANLVAHPEIPSVYASDSIWSYELGMRAKWLNDSLITDTTLFAIDWDNAQFYTTTSDGTQSYTDNVAAVEGRGLEGQVIWLPPIKGVTLTLTGAYSKVETAADYTSSGGTTTPAGTPWPQAPKWQTAASLGWNGRFGARDLAASLTHSFYGKAIQGFFFNDPEIFGYSTYDLQVTLRQPGESWSPDLVLNFNNLTNIRATTYELNSPSPSGGQLRAYTAPRSVSLRLSFDF